MTINVALLCFFASATHLKPQGWASAALPPMTTTTLAFLMSTQWLVIAPRPNVGARLATVGPCQTRAWLSNASIPVLRITLWVIQPVSLLDAEAARKPVVVQRLTVAPAEFLAMKFLSRSSFINLATRVNASSQEMRFHSLVPGARTSGYLR